MEWWGLRYPRAVPYSRLTQSAFAEMRGRNPQVTTRVGFYIVHKRWTGNSQPQEILRHDKAGVVH